ncbi:hypothetical protein WDW37_04615 [Bdellovibrionota bacterium FG-1]
MSQAIGKVSGWMILAFTLSFAAQADIYSRLSPEDQAKINQGEQVVQSEDMDGSVWPKITVLQRAEAMPDQVAAILFDYPLHTAMFEGITKSQPKNPGAVVTEVDYTMTFPRVLGIALPDEDYTVLDTLSAYPDGYEISWTLVKAMTIKDSTGSAKFERLGLGTLISYTNFISPPRPSLAKLIVKMAFQRVSDTVSSLGKHAEAERTSNPALLNGQLAALHKALGH